MIKFWRMKKLKVFEILAGGSGGFIWDRMRTFHLNVWIKGFVGFDRFWKYPCVVGNWQTAQTNLLTSFFYSPIKFFVSFPHTILKLLGEHFRGSELDSIFFLPFLPTLANFISLLPFFVSHINSILFGSSWSTLLIFSISVLENPVVPLPQFWGDHIFVISPHAPKFWGDRLFVLQYL